LAVQRERKTEAFEAYTEIADYVARLEKHIVSRTSFKVA